MKTRLFALAVGLPMLATTGYAQITVDGTVDAGYGSPLATDAALPDAGEGGPDGTDILDVTNLYVTDDGANLYMALEIAGDIATTNWGKYIITIESPAITGTSTTIAWGRAVNVSSNFQVCTWVDFGAGSNYYVWNNGGATWDSVSSGVASAIGSATTPAVVEASVALSQLGNPGTVNLAAFSSGGGTSDPATDIIPGANGNTASWSETSNITTLAAYNISAAGIDDWSVYN